MLQMLNHLDLTMSLNQLFSDIGKWLSISVIQNDLPISENNLPKSEIRLVYRRFGQGCGGRGTIYYFGQPALKTSYVESGRRHSRWNSDMKADCDLGMCAHTFYFPRPCCILHTCMLTASHQIMFRLVLVCELPVFRYFVVIFTCCYNRWDICSQVPL